MIRSHAYTCNNHNDNILLECFRSNISCLKLNKNSDYVGGQSCLNTILRKMNCFCDFEDILRAILRVKLKARPNWRPNWGRFWRRNWWRNKGRFWGRVWGRFWGIFWGRFWGRNRGRFWGWFRGRFLRVILMVWSCSNTILRRFGKRSCLNNMYFT